MTDKVIIWRRPDGGVATCVPSPDSRFINESEAQWLSRVIVKSAPANVSDLQIVSRDLLPQDRVFRAAWAMRDDGQVQVDMPAARDVHRNRLRRARKTLFRRADADISQAMAVADVDRVQATEAHRQTLRDVTQHPDIEAAQTPEELMRVWPLDGPNHSLRLYNRPGPVQDVPRKKAVPAPDTSVLEVPATNAKPTPARPGWVSKTLRRVDNDQTEPVIGNGDGSPPFGIGPELPAQVAEAPDSLVSTVSLAMTLDDASRRRMAHEKMSKAVDEWMQKTFAERPRYELALQALNDLPFALESFQKEAEIEGKSIQQLCTDIVTVHRAKQRRMGHVYTLKAQAIADINAASGDDIERIAAAASDAIMGE